MTVARAEEYRLLLAAAYMTLFCVGLYLRPFGAVDAAVGLSFVDPATGADSIIGRHLHVSGLRTLDDSLTENTAQIRSPEILTKVAQCVGWHGERLMRLRNAWFQRLIPERAIASCDAVIGFDTSSWLLAKRSRKRGKAFILDRTAIHRSTRTSIRAGFENNNQRTAVPSTSPRGIQDDLETEEMTIAARVVVASSFARHSLVEAGIAAEKITVIPYGVNSGWFADGDNRAGCAGKAIFLYVGNLRIDKGVGVLLDAWQQLGAADAELWLVGDGDSAVIQSAGGIAGVRLLGKLATEGLREVYQTATAFVFPTCYDGFGMVLLEAMASGLPIIASPHCAAPELIENEAAGLICPAGNPATLSAAMADVCSHRQSWVQRGAAAREIAKTYSWEAYGARWAALLREVVA